MHQLRNTVLRAAHFLLLRIYPHAPIPLERGDLMTSRSHTQPHASEQRPRARRSTRTPLPWAQAVRLYIHNGAQEKQGITKLLVMIVSVLRGIRVFGPLVTGLDGLILFIPGINLNVILDALVVGDDIVFWPLLVLGLFSFFRIYAIRKKGGL